MCFHVQPAGAGFAPWQMLWTAELTLYVVGSTLLQRQFPQVLEGQAGFGSKCCAVPKDSMGNQNKIVLLISLGLGPCPKVWL